MASSLAQLLVEHGIRLRYVEPNRREHIICPECGGGDTREKSYAVEINENGTGFMATCFRGNCGYMDRAYVTQEQSSRHRSFRSPPPESPSVESNRPEWLYQFFADRNIGARVVHKFGIYATRRKYGDLGEKPTIVFPYYYQGQLVNRKMRPYPEKQPQQQEKDALQTLYNIDCIDKQTEWAIWVEGEPDCLALSECGYDNVVSLKDGAPAKVSATINERDGRFEALRTHGDALEKIKRFYLAGDSDEPGLALREELARRLGRHRCLIVEWPKDCKDACDVLKIHGPTAVQEAVKAARPYPIDGLYRTNAEALLAYRKLPPPKTMTTGTQATDNILHLPMEGRLIIVTGYPTSGKTAWTRFVMIHTAEKHDRHWAVFSPEMQPCDDFLSLCATTLTGKMFYVVPGLDCMTDAETANAGAWLENRVTMLVNDAEKELPTLDWLLERATAAVLRDGCTDFLIDPWNEINQMRGSMAETEFVGKALQRLKAFALRYGCNVWIIAHPAKPLPLKPGEKRPPAGPYDLSGSAHFFNKTDVGITLHVPEPGRSELILWKVRHRRFGSRDRMAEMNYDQLTGRYSSAVDIANNQASYPRSWHDD